MLSNEPMKCEISKGGQGRKEAAFTRTELVVVIGIIIVLLSMFVPANF